MCYGRAGLRSRSCPDSVRDRLHLRSLVPRGAPVIHKYSSHLEGSDEEEGQVLGEHFSVQPIRALPCRRRHRRSHVAPRFVVTRPLFSAVLIRRPAASQDREITWGTKICERRLGS